MRNERRILRNTLLLSGGEAAGQLANLLFVVSVARAFGPEVVGHYSLAMAVGAVASLFVSCGTHMHLTRELSRDPARSSELVGVLVPAHLLLAVAAWLAAAAVSVLLAGDARAIGPLVAVCGYQVLWRTSGLLLVPFRATERMHVPAGTEFGHRLLVLALGGTAIWMGAGPDVTMWSLLVATCILSVIAWWRFARTFGRPRVRLAPAEALALFRAAAPFFGILALSVIYVRGGMIMLAALSSDTAVGQFAAADRLMVAAGLVPVMFGMAVHPALSRVAHSAPAELQALAGRCARLLLLGTLPAAAALSVFAGDVVRLVFGASYAPAAVALQVLAWTMPVRGIQMLLASLLTALEQQHRLARTRLSGLCAFLVLGPAAISVAGIAGLAVAVLVGDLLQTLLYWRLLRRTGEAPRLLMTALRPLGAAAIAALAALAGWEHGFAARIAYFSTAMLTALWVLGAVRAHDLRFLQALLTRRGDAAKGSGSVAP